MWVSALRRVTPCRAASATRNIVSTKFSCPGCCATRSGAQLSRGPRPPSIAGAFAGFASHRHFAVPHRGAGGHAFRRVDDGVGVDTVVAVELADRPGLAKMLDAERFNLVAAHAAEPAEGGGMAVDQIGRAHV